MPATTSVKVAALQLNCQSDPVANRAHATEWIRKAAAEGAEFVATPEYTNIVRLDDRDAIPHARPDTPGHPDLAHYTALARELCIWLLLGSIVVLEENGKLANRSFLISPAGEIAARYDKIHLFDADLPDGTISRESAAVNPGSTAVVADTPFGRLGLAICYDVRFPRLFQALAKDGGATILCVPAAYTVPSGERTWEPFLRARAAETGCFVIAPAQAGTHENGKGRCWGHAAIIDPWGVPISMAQDDKPGIVSATLKLVQGTAARASYPVFRQQREFSLRNSEEPSAAA